MIKTIAIANFRSIHQLILPLSQLNIITGVNGCGKSNLYKALRLLAETAKGSVVNSLAKEGGLESVLWAGPEKISKAMQDGHIPTQGLRRKKSIRLQLGFTEDLFGYTISLGLPEPIPGGTAFARDPEIKNETIWAGDWYRPSNVLIERKGPTVYLKKNHHSEILAKHLTTYDGLFSQIGQNTVCPEVSKIKSSISDWRFYDYFRTDIDSPIRKPQLGTRTPILHHTGNDLAAALQTITEVGDAALLHQVIDYAFPNSCLKILHHEGYFSIGLQQQGILRPLSAFELSDGTLRYLLLVAIFLTPRPPSLMVVNEPENSIHEDLLPALAKLITNASKHSQIWLVTHSHKLIYELEEQADCNILELEKIMGQIKLKKQRQLDEPAWYWPDKYCLWLHLTLT